MYVTHAIYGACSAAFLLLIGLLLLQGKPSRTAMAVVGACAVTAAWAAATALPGFLLPVASDVLDSLRLSVWLILTVLLIGLRSHPENRYAHVPIIAVTGVCVLVVGFDALGIVARESATDGFRRLHDFSRVGLSVVGLLAAENLLRNAAETGRRAVLPLCLALGAMFAFELFVYADQLMLPGKTPFLSDGRGLVAILSVPLLAAAMARNRQWQVDIHISHAVVLHTAALVASGVFFVALAGIGLIVRELGGAWGPPLQVLTLLGSAVVLISVLGSRDVRAQLKRMIARHFFSHRFDYREEWRRFVNTVSQARIAGERLPVRVIRALAQIVDSPAGLLWCLHEAGGFMPETGWELGIECGRKIPIDHSFIAGFRSGRWIQEQPAIADPNWPVDSTRGWLAVPLSHNDTLIAFVILAPPRRRYSLDQESFDLLRTAGRHAASYLAEQRSTQALLDAKLLTEYSKHFAFVIHDIKNISSQLGLAVSNARRHIEDPEFRNDMLQTLEDSVARMNRLIAQLNAGSKEARQQVIEPDKVIASLARELLSIGTPIETRLDANDYRVAIDSDQFRSVLSHLINNAREAADAEVVVASRGLGDKLTIDVVDSGPGMDDDFVRNELFRPFRSSKPDGMGIGGFQTRELLRMAGGELEVISEKGAGTIMRVTFPVHRSAEPAASAV